MIHIDIKKLDDHSRVAKVMPSEKRRSAIMFLLAYYNSLGSYERPISRLGLTKDNVLRLHS